MSHQLNRPRQFSSNYITSNIFWWFGVIVLKNKTPNIIKKITKIVMRSYTTILCKIMVSKIY